VAWYPGAQRMELQPESDAQPAIRPTQLIMHSIAAPWNEQRIYEYWRDSTNLESHFGLDFDGSLGQFIGTQTRADANMYANLRPDGTGAVSIETASNTEHTDPWTDAQIEQLIRLGVWLHQTHGIPLRICRTWDDPGYGYHRLFPQWSNGGTACPGDARVQQFHGRVFPGIVAAANGGPTNIPAPMEEDPLMAFTEADLRRFVREEVMSQEVRDRTAFATWWWFVQALGGADVPPTGNWWDALYPQLREALGKLPPAALDQLRRALADTAVTVHVDVNQPTTNS